MDRLPYLIPQVIGLFLLGLLLAVRFRLLSAGLPQHWGFLGEGWDGGRRWGLGRPDAFLGLVLFRDALAGEFVGPGVLDILGDGLVSALGLGLLLEVVGVLLDALHDATWDGMYLDMFSLET